MSRRGEMPNCENCPAIGCKDHGLYSQYPKECELFTRKRGCPSHPEFRKWFMKDIIEELERRRGITSMRNDDTPNYLTQGNTYESRMYAFDDAIEVIMNWVKND